MKLTDILINCKGRISVHYLDNGIACVMVDGVVRKYVNTPYLKKVLKKIKYKL